MCKFFIGSRMHACIAALSQCIPAVGIAYSKKFDGVFESIGMSDCVIDARVHDESEILRRIESIFDRKENIRKDLEQTMGGIKNDIINIFENSQIKVLQD